MFWESCLDKLRPKIDARDASQLCPRLDAGRLDVIANPFLLERIFETILECIAHDASEDAEIIVSSEVAANKAYYHFYDNSGGVPLDDFRRSFDVAAGSREDSVEAVSLSVLTPSQIDHFREIESWLEVSGMQRYQFALPTITTASTLNSHSKSNRIVWLIRIQSIRTISCQTGLNGYSRVRFEFASISV